MRRLKTVLNNLNFRGHISLRKWSLGELVYITGCDTRYDFSLNNLIRGYGDYLIEKSEVIDGVLVIYVN